MEGEKETQLTVLRPPPHLAVQAADNDCDVLGEWATKYSTAAQQMGWADLSSPLWCCQDAAGIQCDSAHRVVSLNVNGKHIEGACACDSARCVCACDSVCV